MFAIGKGSACYRKGLDQVAQNSDARRIGEQANAVAGIATDAVAFGSGGPADSDIAAILYPDTPRSTARDGVAPDPDV